MPNIKSAKKRVRVIVVKSAENKARRSRMRSVIKKAELSLAGPASECAQSIGLAIKTLDQAAAKGIIHKNTAARKKSALTRKLNAIG